MTIDELKVFTGLVILMGIIQKPSINLYWATDALYHTSIFFQVMNYNRLNLILKFLHFNNNEDPTFDQNDGNRNRLHKVRPLINIFRDRGKSVYSSGKKLSVDESLVLFKGRLLFKQYIKTKRARFCIRLYQLCTSVGKGSRSLLYKHR